MECSICLEPLNEPEFCKYTCDHGSFHIRCISKCLTCPLCRADVKVKNRRILIWHENQRYPAGIYKEAKNLHDLPIVVIKSMDEWVPGDIVYHYVGGTG